MAVTVKTHVYSALASVAQLIGRSPMGLLVTGSGPH